MKKIITAINNPKLNEELRKEKNFEIIGKDIQYKEAILEILEKNNNIDLIILSEKIPGEIKLEKLIEKIKLINEKIKIIFILEKENNELEKILIKNNIKDIYYNNKINLKELIKIINKKEINMEEEIIKLKKIIEEKNIDYNNFENNNIKNDKRNNKNKKSFKNKKLRILQKEKRNIAKIEQEASNPRNMSTKIITFSGNYKSGKTTLSLIVSQCLADKDYKVLLIDGDLEKQDLSIILKKDKWNRYQKKQNQNKKENKNKKNNYFYKRNKNNINKDNINKNITNKNNIIKRTKLNTKKNQRKIKLINIKNKLINKYKKLTNKKNTIYYYPTKDIINLFTIKINYNLYFFNGLNYLLKNKIIKKENIVKKIIFIFIEIIKKSYDFVIIDLSKSNLGIINEEILMKGDINLIIMEANLLGIREVEGMLEIYLKEWNIRKNSLHIITNKKNFSSINRNLISNYLNIKNKIIEIKENKIYHIFISKYFKRKILIKNKITKKEINKIIKEIKKK